MREFVLKGNGRPRPYANLITTVTLLLKQSCISAIAVDVIKSCISLKRLHLQISCEYFSNHFGRPYMIDRKWTKLEFEEQDPDIFPLRGISSLTMEPWTDGCNCLDEEVYQDNLVTFRQNLKTFACQARPADWSIAEGGKEDEAKDETASQSPALANNKLEAEPTSERSLWPLAKLSQGLKDVIVEMAYVPRKKAKPLPKASFDDEERRLRQGD